MKNPLVSILIASYNKEKYVNRCIKSCLSQTYKNIEHIVVDGGSNDQTCSILKNYTNKKKKYSIKKFLEFINQLIMQLNKLQVNIYAF